jgi:hypothetical protein
MEDSEEGKKPAWSGYISMESGNVYISQIGGQSFSPVNTMRGISTGRPETPEPAGRFAQKG